MKRLLLLRHAKSNKHFLGMQDFDRPLNDRGVTSASLIGKYIGKKGIQVGLVLSSPAERARQTAELVVKTAGVAAELRFDERIYEASSSQLQNVIRQIDPEVSVALLVGHNPGFEDLQTAMTGQHRQMPTATLACLSLDIEKWSDIREQSGELKWMITPKELEDV